MKRFSKILALTLLLAVVVTAFGVFGASAEAVRAVNFNMDTDLDLTDSDVITNLTNKTTVEKLTDENGRTYWKETLTSSSANGLLQLGSGLALSDMSYLVYDFDISYEDERLTQGVTFKPRFRNGTDDYFDDLTIIINPGTYNAETGRHISINTVANSELNLGADIDIGDDTWVDVSIVYDFTNISNQSVKCYIYINGQYAGNTTAEGVDANAYRYLRLYAGGKGPKNSSINWANFTISTFTGTFSGTLGNELSTIPELGYCLENSLNPSDEPAEPDVPAEPCTLHTDANNDCVCDICDEAVSAYIASVGGVNYDNIEDLQYAVTTKGGTVTLYKKPNDFLFYSAGVSFVTEAGASVTDNHVVEIEAGASWAFIVNGKYVFRTTTVENTYVEGSTIHDELHSTLASKRGEDIRVVLFDDINMYGVVSTRLQFTQTITINLNGHTLDVDNYSANRNVFEPNATDATISFYHGAIEYASVNHSGLYLIGSTSEPHSKFYNCDITADNNFLTQRGGTTVFDGCEITANATLATLTAKNGLGSALTVNNCTITGTTKLSNDAAIFQMGPQSSNGTVNNTLNITNTTIDVPSNIILHETRSTGSQSDTNIFNINIVNSTVTSSGRSIFADKANPKTPDATGEYDLIETITLNVTNSALNAHHYIYTRVSVNNYDPADYNKAEYTFTVNADATSKLYAHNALANKVYTHTSTNDSDEEIETRIEHDSVVITFNLENGVLLNYKNIHTTCETTAPVVNIPDGCLIVYTSLGGKIDSEALNEEYDAYYTRIVSSNYTEEYNWKKGEENGTFRWNIAEGEIIDPSLVESNTTSTDIYKYTWVKSETADDGYVNTFVEQLGANFAPNFSISVSGSIAFNVFVPAGVEILVGDGYVVENGVILSQYGKDGEWNMAKVSAIQPTEFTKTCKITIRITGAYEDSVDLTVSPNLKKYATNALAQYDAESAEAKYVIQLLGYIKAVMEYSDANLETDYSEDRDYIATLLTDKTLAGFEDIKTADKINTSGRGFKNVGVKLALNLGGTINWEYTVLEGFENDTFQIDYILNGESIQIVRKADANGKIIIPLHAYDLLGAGSDKAYGTDDDISNMIKITNLNNELYQRYNLHAYYEALSENEAAQSVVEALAAYANAAIEYKAQLDAVSAN